jgi:hypothetical protein
MNYLVNFARIVLLVTLAVVTIAGMASAAYYTWILGGPLVAVAVTVVIAWAVWIVGEHGDKF